MHLHTSHKIMNGAFDNYIGTDKKIPTNKSRRNYSTKNESILKHRETDGSTKRNKKVT